MTRLASILALAGFSIAGSLVSGCSGEDNLDKAAAPSTSTSNVPPPVPNKKLNKMPPLAGPNAGQGGPAGI